MANTNITIHGNEVLLDANGVAYIRADAGVKVGDLVVYCDVVLKRVEWLGEPDGDEYLDAKLSDAHDRYQNHRVRRDGDAWVFEADGIVADGDWLRAAGFHGRIKYNDGEFAFVSAGDKVEFEFIDKTDAVAEADKRDAAQVAADEAAEAAAHARWLKG